MNVQAISVIFFLIILFPFESQASEGALWRVRSIVGSAFCDDKALKVNDKIKLPCKIQVHSRSNVFLEQKSSTLALGEEVRGEFSTDRRLQLNSGIIRVQIDTPIKIVTDNSEIDTAEADFLIRIGETLQETEVINLQGKIMFKNLKSENDKVTLLPKLWAGVGGRFGKVIGDLFALNNDQVKIYDRLLKPAK